MSKNKASICGAFFGKFDPPNCAVLDHFQTTVNQTSRDSCAFSYRECARVARTLTLNFGQRRLKSHSSSRAKILHRFMSPSQLPAINGPELADWGRAARQDWRARAAGE
jgi:hypothetical protein